MEFLSMAFLLSLSFSLSLSLFLSVSVADDDDDEDSTSGWNILSISSSLNNGSCMLPWP